jgi:hypothetical protein
LLDTFAGLRRAVARPSPAGSPSANAWRNRPQRAGAPARSTCGSSSKRRRASQPANSAGERARAGREDPRRRARTYSAVRGKDSGVGATRTAARRVQELAGYDPRHFAGTSTLESAHHGGEVGSKLRAYADGIHASPNRLAERRPPGVSTASSAVRPHHRGRSRLLADVSRKLDEVENKDESCANWGGVGRRGGRVPDGCTSSPGAPTAARRWRSGWRK